MLDRLGHEVLGLTGDAAPVVAGPPRHRRQRSSRRPTWQAWAIPGHQASRVKFNGPHRNSGSH
jgi:hypothetical protein